MNLSKSSLDRERLAKAVKYHHRNLEPVRKRRMQAIRQCAGDLYGKDDKRTRKTILGLLRQAQDAHVMGLAPNLPKVLVTAKQPGKSAFAKHVTRALNSHLHEIRFEQTLQEAAADSFYGSAFIKVYLAQSLFEIEEDLDVWVDPGQGFAERKSIDDLVFDTEASDFRKCTFICDRFRLPLEALLEDKQRFSRKAVEALYATKRDEEHESRFIAGEKEDEQGRLLDMIDLVDVYVRRERRTYTFAANANFDIRPLPPLQVVDWEGGDDGPYKMLNLGVVPDNILSSSPANYLYHLDVGVNQVWRKTLRQMQRMKVIGVADTNGDDKDVAKFNNAEDGEVVSGDPETIKEVRYGGPDNQLLGTVEILKNQFDRMAGNLAIKAGLGSSTDTLGQDKMLGAQVTRIEAAQQYAFKKFAESVVSELGRMLWDDPASSYETMAEFSGSTIRVPTKWEPSTTPDSRQGEWDDYQYCIEPYPVPYKSPDQRGMELRQLTAELAQMLPMMMQMGVDVAAYVELLAELHSSVTSSRSSCSRRWNSSSKASSRRCRATSRTASTAGRT